MGSQTRAGGGTCPSRDLIEYVLGAESGARGGRPSAAAAGALRL
jgi:hypothetical protein